MFDRRDLLRRAAVGAAVFGLPFRFTERALANDTLSLPSATLFSTDPERYWADLRKQWLLVPDRINLNCGAVGCSPLPVIHAVIDHLLASERFAEPGYPWFGYEEKPILRDLRDRLASFLGCKRDELALIRNATEGNNIVCHGLDLKEGDEVLLTDQEHVGGRSCWEQRAKRHGIKLNFVTLPKPPASASEIVDRVSAALTPRTRVLAFSHITTVTGLVMPVKEICAVARQRNVITLVDGAHSIGQIPVNLHDLGCDFHTTSPHKWLMAPKGTGTLYIRDEWVDRLWVHTASGDWNNLKLKAWRFSVIGTSNLSNMVGLKAALDFHQAIGPERVYARIHQLASRMREFMQRYPQYHIVNASADAFFAGMVSIEPVKGDLGKLIVECAKRKIRHNGGLQRLRFATHIFTQPRELDTFHDALESSTRG